MYFFRIATTKSIKLIPLNLLQLIKIILLLCIRITKHLLASKYQPLKYSSQVSLRIIILQINFRRSMLKNYLLKREFFLSNNETNIKQHYQFLRQIGRGSYGVVYETRSKFFPYDLRVVKRLSKRKVKNPTSLYNEVHIMSRLDHPHIVKLYETYEDSQNIFLVMDLCAGGELYHRLIEVNNFNEEKARIIFKQMINAVNYLHKQRIIHRDLKLQNFMMKRKDSWEISLIDFGLSFEWSQNAKQELGKHNQQKIIGTAYYLSPEVLYKNYDERCDIWSLGVILYMMVTGTPPFDGQSDDEIVQSIKIHKLKVDTPQCLSLSPSLLHLISSILRPEHQRITFQDLFQHPWMKQPVQSLQEPLQLQLQTIIKYSNISKLKKIVATFIAAHLSESEIQKIRILFQKIDTNNDGFISIQELQTFLGGEYNDLNEIFISIDSDKNGLINYNEFISCCIDESFTSSKEYIRYVFNSFDLNRDGRIQRQEFTLILRAFNKDFECNQRLVEALIQENDNNHDGVIDFQEFQQSMQSLRGINANVQ